MKLHSRYEKARKFLIFWCLFIGVGALFGASCMLIKTDGSILQMQGVLPYFQVLPLAEYLFQDFLFPGIALLCVNGIPNLLAAGLLLKKKREGILLGTLFGVTLMLWICIQFIIFPMNFMSTIYFIFGLAQFITGYVTSVFYRQEKFQANQANCLDSHYGNIGNNKKQLVVYFSRMGYTKKIAYETANESGAELYEIKATERTEGTLGFWWCGRYGMHRWAMPIEEPEFDFSAYENVTICSPIWVFQLAGPVRRFCEMTCGKIKNVDYILVHHQKSKYQNAFDEMDRLLQTKHGKAKSIRCHVGNYEVISDEASC